MVKIENIGVKDFNSYLIMGDCNIIIDTVPEMYFNEFIENIEKNISLSEIDFLVMGRTTPDATGCVRDLILKNSDLNVFSTVAGLKNLKEITNLSFFENVIKNEGYIKITEDKLRFLITPNLSWPDTCIFYLENEKTLFSENLFCESPEMEAFQNEFLAYATEITESLDINMVLPAYGCVKDKNVYDNFYPEENEISIVFESKSGQTKKMAEAVFDELIDMGENVVLLDASTVSRDEILDRIKASKAFCFGTPTINHNAAESVLDVITRMNILTNIEKKVYVFGSYGWSGEGVNIVASLLGNMKMKPCKKPYRCIFNPTDDSLQELRKEVRKFFEVTENA